MVERDKFIENINFLISKKYYDKIFLEGSGVMKKTNVGNIDLDELKGKFSEIKAAAEKAKEENKEVPKQSLGKKILGIGAIILLLGGVVWVLLSSLDMLILPKNTIKIIVSDQNGEGIPDLMVKVEHKNGGFDEDFINESEIIIFGAIPGEYRVTFERVPEGYTCDTLYDTVTLEEDNKVKVEYECRKIDVK